MFEKQVIYVELDALLDTRLGTLHGVNPEYAEQIFQNPAYYTRVSDDFSLLCGITKEAYDQAYSKRNIETLMNSRLTSASVLVNRVCEELEYQRVNTPYTEDTRIELNLWPYTVDEITAFELENAVAALVPVDVAVKSVNISYRDLTIDSVKSKYSGMFIYNFREWFQYHHKEFEFSRIPQVTVMAPRLHFDGRTTLFDSKSLGVDVPDVDPYETMQRAISPLIGLEFVDPELYSIVLPSSGHFEQAEEKADSIQPEA